MVKLEVGHDLNNMKSMETILTEFNSIQKYYKQKKHLESF